MTMALPQSSATGSRPAYLDGLYRDTYTSCRDIPNTPPASLHSYPSSISNTSTASTYSLRSAYQSARPPSPPIQEYSSDSISIRSKKSFLSPKKRFRLGTILQRNHGRPFTYPQTSQEFEPPATVGPVYNEVSAAPSPPPAASGPSAPLLEESPVVPKSLRRSPSLPCRPSLPKLQTSFATPDFGPPEARSTYERKALPAIPGTPQSPSRQLSQKQQSSRQKSLRSRPSIKRPALSLESIVQTTSDLGCQKCYYYAVRNCNGYVLGGDAGDACETCLSAGFFGAK